MRHKIIVTLTVGILVLVVLITYLVMPTIFGSIVLRDDRPLFPDYQIQLIRIYANKYGIDGCLIGAVILTESNGNPRAGSYAGARGLMQLMPTTAAGLAPLAGVTYNGPDDLWDPEKNIAIGALYLARLIRRYGVHDALVAYNGGPGRVALAQSQRPLETQRYPGKVMAYLTKVQSRHADLCGVNRLTPIEAQPQEQFSPLPDIPETGVDLNPDQLWQFFLQ